jgi:hypothetical protein
MPQIPVFGFYSFWVVVDVLVLGGPIYDLIRSRKLRKAYLYGGLRIIAAQPFRLWFMNSVATCSYIDEEPEMGDIRADHGGLGAAGTTGTSVRVPVMGCRNPRGVQPEAASVLDPFAT